MGDAWFTEYADELARCLVDARDCAETCEAYLESLRDAGDQAALAGAVDALAAPAAVSRVLIELIDQPPQLVLAAARLCRETAAAAAAYLDGRDDPGAVVTALERVAGSAAALVEAAG